MSTDVRLSPNAIVIVSLWRNTLWTQVLWSTGKTQRSFLFQFHSKQPESSSQQAAFLYWQDWYGTCLDVLTLHSSRQILIVREMYIGFLKPAALWNGTAWKRITHEKGECHKAVKTVQRSKNLFFIIKNVFLDGVGSLKCSILKWGHWCLQRTLSWSDHN